MRDVTFVAWRDVAWGEGAHLGTAVVDGALTLVTATGTRAYTDPPVGSTSTYDTATWTSPTIGPGFAIAELVASWNATTPTGTWLEVRVRTLTRDSSGSWFVMGRWASDDPADGGAIHRCSVPDQATSWATVRTDTLVTRGGPGLVSWQLELTLLRRTGTTVTPAVTLLGAMVSGPSATGPARPSALGPASARGIELDVPTLSQEVHRGHYPRWDAGGEAWCSPTSVAMVLAFWGTGPTPAETAWVHPAVDAVVDHAARQVFDYAYDAAGNWPFNTAYAARYGLEAFVTRLRSLTEAETFVAAGIPLVASVSFDESELTGAGYSTGGHLIVIRGFTPAGDVVVNDPASHLVADNGQVRAVYDRAELEAAWLRGSGGIVYVIHPRAVPLPDPPAQAGW
ncbi:MAG: C39 family peptidase [Lapillicoccus sp.]